MEKNKKTRRNGNYETTHHCCSRVERELNAGSVIVVPELVQKKTKSLTSCCEDFEVRVVYGAFTLKIFQIQLDLDAVTLRDVTDGVHTVDVAFLTS